MLDPNGRMSTINVYSDSLEGADEALLTAERHWADKAGLQVDDNFSRDDPATNRYKNYEGRRVLNRQRILTKTKYDKYKVKYNLTYDSPSGHVAPSKTYWYTKSRFRKGVPINSATLKRASKIGDDFRTVKKWASRGVKGLAVATLVLSAADASAQSQQRCGALIHSMNQLRVENDEASQFKVAEKLRELAKIEANIGTYGTALKTATEKLIPVPEEEIPNPFRR